MTFAAGPIGVDKCLAQAIGGENVAIARGQHTTVAASDTVDTGLESVDGAVVSLESDPGLDPLFVTVVPSTSGNILIKTWKATGAGDVTPIAATTFSKKVQWVAWGKPKTS